MRSGGVPYRVVGGMKFFDRAEVKDMLAYLCVLNNPLDDLRLRRIINNPPRGIGATTIDKAAALAAEQGASLYEVCRNADLFPELKGASAKLLRFADLVDGLRKAGGDLALPEFYDEVCEQTGYTQALRDKNDMESRGRLENVQELKSNILSFLERQPEDATLSGFLNEIALYTDLDSLESGDDCVTLMTIHAAKGLEFPMVYVVGLEEGVFPGNSAQFEEEEVEEERRLCYVAMTRAKRRLTLTCARQRMLYGRTASNRRSRFLEELPAEKVKWEGGEPEAGGRFSAYGAAYGGGGYSGGPVQRPGGGGTYSRPARPAYQEARRAPAGQTAPPPISLAQGDRVEHGTFGQGTVLSVQPMGGDALILVDFENTGKKKLMLKAAARHLKKLGK